jgi:hypothetical protein
VVRQDLCLLLDHQWAVYLLRFGWYAQCLICVYSSRDGEEHDENDGCDGGGCVVPFAAGGVVAHGHFDEGKKTRLDSWGKSDSDYEVKKLE